MYSNQHTREHSFRTSERNFVGPHARHVFWHEPFPSIIINHANKAIKHMPGETVTERQRTATNGTDGAGCLSLRQAIYDGQQ